MSADIYIHLRKTSWKKNREIRNRYTRGLQGAISAAYKTNARILEGALPLSPQELKQLKRLVDFRSRAKSHSPEQEALNTLLKEVSTFVSTELPKMKVLGKIGLGQMQNAVLDEIPLSVSTLAEIVDNYEKALKQIDLYFAKLSILDPAFAPKEAHIYGLSRAELKSARTARDNVQLFLKKWGGVDNIEGMEQQIKQDIIGATRRLLGDVKGGLFEYADYVYGAALGQGMKEIEQHVKILGAEMTGAKDVYDKNDKRKQEKFSAKSDTVYAIGVVNDSNMQIEFKVGLSNKSYKKEDAIGRSIAKNISWRAAFDHGIPMEPGFENFYANTYMHETDLVNQGAKDINKYLAAMSSSFLISGVSGTSQKGGGGTFVPQAMFMRYANETVYIPHLLNDLADKGTAGIFKIKPDILNDTKSSPIANKRMEGEDDDLAAQERSNYILSQLERRVRFNATR